MIQQCDFILLCNFTTLTVSATIYIRATGTNLHDESMRDDAFCGLDISQVPIRDFYSEETSKRLTNDGHLPGRCGRVLRAGSSDGTVQLRVH